MIRHPNQVPIVPKSLSPERKLIGELALGARQDLIALALTRGWTHDEQGRKEVYYMPANPRHSIRVPEQGILQWPTRVTDHYDTEGLWRLSEVLDRSVVAMGLYWPTGRNNYTTDFVFTTDGEAAFGIGDDQSIKDERNWRGGVTSKHLLVGATACAALCREAALQGCIQQTGVPIPYEAIAEALLDEAPDQPDAQTAISHVGRRDFYIPPDLKHVVASMTPAS